MSFELLLEPLRQVPLFQGLRPIQIAEIARHAERVMFRDGNVIIQEDQDADAAFLIISGDVVRISGPASSEPVPTGSLVGEMAMLVETTHSSTVVCKGSVRVLKITRQALHERMQADPTLADHFVSKLLSRLQSLADDLRRVDQLLAAEPPATATLLPARLLPLSTDAGLHAPR